MNCELCGEHPAKVQFTEVVGIQKEAQWLCEVCAEAQGLVVWEDTPDADAAEEGAANFLATLVVEGPSVSTDKPLQRCSTCGVSLSSLRRTGRLGCGDCYDTFRENLEPLLRRVHGATQHRGAGPGGQEEAVRMQRELSGLQKDLNEAIRREDYERAAALRDQIQRYETELSRRGEAR